MAAIAIKKPDQLSGYICGPIRYSGHMDLDTIWFTLKLTIQIPESFVFGMLTVFGIQTDPLCIEIGDFHCLDDKVQLQSEIFSLFLNGCLICGPFNNRRAFDPLETRLL
jgi:hypothetical protein